MTVDHYIVFIGAGARLSEELSIIEKRIERSKVIAPAVGRHNTGITEAAVKAASSSLYEELSKEESLSQQDRLYVWMYDQTSAGQNNLVMSAFGHASWIEKVSRLYLHKIRHTRESMEHRISEIQPLLKEVSAAVFAGRRTSPLSLPLRNFDSDVTRDLKLHWYRDLDLEEITQKIESFGDQHLQTYSRERRGYIDENKLVFQPASNNECHGRPHPTGSEHKSFFCGRFRYGVSLFPGFHFDVEPERGSTIQCDLRTASGEIRSVRSKKMTRINIYPNDFLRP